MKKWILPSLSVLILSAAISPNIARAEIDTLALEEAAAEDIKDHPEWINALKTQHHLQEEHIKWMLEKGLSYPQMIIVSSLSEKSGKTVDDILDMRAGGKMAWRKISNELGISDEEIGQSIATVRQGVKEELRSAKEEKKEAKRDENSLKKDMLRKKG